MIKYFFVGVGKCGTSWIYSFCKRHNLIDVPSIKEPQLLECAPKERDRRLRAYYSGTGQKGDFSNTYFFDAGNAQTIKNYEPNAKIIITVRMPSKRIISHFQFLRRNGLDPTVTIEDYLTAGDEVSIVARSDYASMIERYVETFGAKNVLVLPIELLRINPQMYADALCDFLEAERLEIGDEDTRTVLAAAQPRNAFVARTAKSLAEFLRAKGFLSALSFAKENKIVRAVLYNKNVSKIDNDFGVHDARIQKLDASYPDLLKKYVPDIVDVLDMR